MPYYTRLAARFAWAGAAVQLAASLYWLPSAPYASLGALGAVMAGLGAWVLPRIRKGESLAPAVAFLVGGGLSGVAAAYTALTGWVTLILNRYAHPAGPD